MVIEIDKRNNSVVLSLGGNIGSVKEVFSRSIESLENKLGKLILSSSVYQTKAWGVENQSDFLNQVMIINTLKSPNEVLEICLMVEKKQGRDRSGDEKWRERTIDIDVLFYGDEIINSTDLIIPHPYIQDRNFVLFPLVEIIPDFMHPKLKKTLRELKKRCTDKLQVVKTLD